jgi:hypothetical protein
MCLLFHQEVEGFIFRSYIFMCYHILEVNDGKIEVFFGACAENESTEAMIVGQDRSSMQNLWYRPPKLRVVYIGERFNVASVERPRSIGHVFVEISKSLELRVAALKTLGQPGDVTSI